tara:strand:+ start:33057 stop:33299 length:243 start_codon:yes stop_codon:yes gene_type:complete
MKPLETLETLDKIADCIIWFSLGALVVLSLFMCLNNDYYETKKTLTKIEKTCEQVGSEPKEFDWNQEAVCKNGFTFIYEE